MTTSFETSLRMKELNFPQEGGEYYHVDRNGEVICARCRTINDTILCRAFTLGELVRMMPDGTTIKKKMHNAYTAEVYWKGDDAINTSPEEAAAELAIELVGSGVIKFNINQKI